MLALVPSLGLPAETGCSEPIWSVRVAVFFLILESAKALGQWQREMPKIPTVWTWPKSQRREIEREEAVSGELSICDCRGA